MICINAEIRRLSGFSRVEVYGLLKRLEEEGKKVRFVGRGRGAYIVLAERK
jgi:predicted transcriptional regulator